MYALNKIVAYLVSPVGFAMVLVGVAVLARVRGRRRLAGWTVVLAFANLWLWSTPLMSRWVSVPLEAEFLVEGRVPAVESFPEADLIVLPGGAMGVATNIGSRAEMWTSADRVWQAASLWREQGERRREKGESAEPKILVTSAGTDLSTGPLLEDLGVPEDAIIYDFGPRNTEEEAKKVSGFRFQVSGGGLETSNLKLETNNRPKALVVTSAWHMKRTMLMYRKYAPNVEAIPAPCDFENTLGAANASGFKALLPDPQVLMWNSIAFKEWLGYFGYRYLR